MKKQKTNSKLRNTLQNNLKFLKSKDPDNQEKIKELFHIEED